MSTSIIEVEGLEHQYGDFKAVNGISFTVGKGEIFSFLGPNGAGKSTAINILITLLKLQKGEACIAGYDVRTEAEKVRESIGIVFQEVTLDRDMTVWEILEFHGRLYGMTRPDRKERIAEILELVKLGGQKDMLVKKLSGGMKRRLEIGRGLMTRPIVLFLDEPTIGLDPQTRMRMWDYIRTVNDEGTTIFLTTHYMDEADNLSDRINIIDHGKIIASGKPWELKNELGQDLVYLETSDNPRARSIITDLVSISGVSDKGKGILITTNDDGTKILPLIIEEIRNSGISVITVNLKKPSMDDVFVHFTGRELRDDKPGKSPATFRRR